MTTIEMTTASRRGLTKAPTATAVLHLWDRARDGWGQAAMAETPADRYIGAHLAALRAGAALLAAHQVPGPRSRPRSVWELLPQVAPELTDWALYYTGTGRRRVKLEQGTGTVEEQEAHDLVVQAERFIELVRELLDIPVPPSSGDLFATAAR